MSSPARPAIRRRLLGALVVLVLGASLAPVALTEPAPARVAPERRVGGLFVAPAALVAPRRMTAAGQGPAPQVLVRRPPMPAAILQPRVRDALPLPSVVLVARAAAPSFGTLTGLAVAPSAQASGHGEGPGRFDAGRASGARADRASRVSRPLVPRAGRAPAGLPPALSAFAPAPAGDVSGSAGGAGTHPLSGDTASPSPVALPASGTALAGGLLVLWLAARAGRRRRRGTVQAASFWISRSSAP